MVSTETRELVVRWKSEGRLSIRRISRVLGVSRNTVRRILAGEPKERDKRTDAGAFLQDHSQEVEASFIECEFMCPALRRKLRHDFDIDIPLRMLQRHCQSLRKEFQRKALIEDVVTRFETSPGQHLQIDFGEKDVLVNGVEVRIHFFTCKMAYSRRVYAKAYYQETQAAWLDGLESAFAYFGGLPRCIVCDNASSLVRDHYAASDELRFTERFYSFLVYYGIKGIATAVKHPRSKGKVEAGVKYIKGNPLVGVDKPSLEERNVWLETWCRTESDKRKLTTLFEGPYTPAERWKIESRAMRPNTKPRMARVFNESRRVTKDSLIRVENRYYQIDRQYIGREVLIRHDQSTITVTYGGAMIATLDKAADAFNPERQSESTLPVHEEAEQKQLAALGQDPLWTSLQNSPNELNRPGEAYNEAVNWPQAGINRTGGLQ